TDLAPSDYHLFKHLQNFLDGTKLASREACENELVKFFTNRDEDFFNRGIMKLPSRWTKVIRTKRRIFDLNRIILTMLISSSK
ncbi:Histone-lysine N-methyltransferase SETMAR, partial [Habropoda laboriosa]